jgi:hypothetical protein
MIKTDRITRCKNDNDIPEEELEYLLSLYQEEYNSYRKEYGGNYKKYKLFTKSGKKGKIYPHIVNLHKLLQVLKNVTPHVFVKAQFYYRGLIDPWKIIDKKIVDYYYGYLDTLPNEERKESDLIRTIEYTKKRIDKLCKEWGVTNTLKSFFEAKNDKGIYLFIVEYMICDLPPVILMCNSQSFMNIYSLIDADFRRELPDEDKIVEMSKNYIKYPKLLKTFKDIFGEKESVL